MPIKYSSNPIFKFNARNKTKSADGVYTVDEKSQTTAKHPEYLPTWDTKEFYPPLKFFEHTDPGTRADPAYPNLLQGATTKKITPKLGVEIKGVQLSQLTDAGKDELALLVAKQGLAVFRDQDLASYGPKNLADYGRYFGPLHIHPTSGAPKGAPELHIVYRGDQTNVDLFQNRNSLVAWHSDVSYELQPPGVTFFAILDGPEAGSDTLFADTVEAYNRLSDAFKKRLEGLHVLHTSVSQAKFSRQYGGAEKRDPVNNIHPLVRTIPSTGEKALYINPQFSRKIVELKEEESEYLTSFLIEHIAKGHDFQARARYEPGTVVVWDNRRVVHSALADSLESRHCVRVTPQFERPVYDLKDLNKPDENKYTPRDEAVYED